MHALPDRARKIKDHAVIPVIRDRSLIMVNTDPSGALPVNVLNLLQHVENDILKSSSL